MLQSAGSRPYPDQMEDLRLDMTRIDPWSVSRDCVNLTLIEGLIYTTAISTDPQQTHLHPGVMTLDNILIVYCFEPIWLLTYNTAWIIIIHCSFIGQRRTGPLAEPGFSQGFFLSILSPDGVLVSCHCCLFSPLLPLAWLD